MSKHFSKLEMVRCFRENGARCEGCRLAQPAKQLPYGIEENLQALVSNVLEPVRELLGKPIVVNSGFRCPIHNVAVGGVANSQHMKGEAVDITCDDNKGLAEIIEQLGKYDQLIMYKRPDGSIRFIHVSWKRNGVNRKMVLNK